MRDTHGNHAGDYDANYDIAARYRANRRAHADKYADPDAAYRATDFPCCDANEHAHDRTHQHADSHPDYPTYCTPNCTTNCPGHFTDNGGHITVTLTNQHSVPAIDTWWTRHRQQ